MTDANPTEKAMESIEARVSLWLKNPWLQYHRPFKVIENIYYVGTDWVSAYLIDTSEGLILIDCAMQETWYLIMDSIYQLGFDPHNIKKLFLSHGHFDHCGAARVVQEMSGCETWIGADEAFFFTERRDLIAHEETVPQFRIDRFYEYDAWMDFGNCRIRPVHCPGHTPGTTTFFIEVVHEGKTLVCAMHGGLGAGVLTKKELEKSGYSVRATRDTYYRSIDRVIDEHVDVLIPSHVGHCVDHDFYGCADADDGSGNTFIDETAWKRMLIGKKKEVELLDETGR